MVSSDGFPCSVAVQCHSQLELSALASDPHPPAQCLEVAWSCPPPSRDSLQDLQVLINWWGLGYSARAHVPQGMPTYPTWVSEASWAFN